MQHEPAQPWAAALSSVSRAWRVRAARRLAGAPRGRPLLQIRGRRGHLGSASGRLDEEATLKGSALAPSGLPAAPLRGFLSVPGEEGSCWRLGDRATAPANTVAPDQHVPVSESRKILRREPEFLSRSRTGQTVKLGPCGVSPALGARSQDTNRRAGTLGSSWKEPVSEGQRTVWNGAEFVCDAYVRFWRAGRAARVSATEASPRLSLSLSPPTGRREEGHGKPGVRLSPSAHHPRPRLSS